MPRATDAKAAEGRAHSMTLARGRMILELCGASWSGPALWRFPISGRTAPTSGKAGCCDLKCRVPPMPKRRRAAALHDAGAWTDDSRTARSVLEWARHLALSHQWPHRAHKWQGRLLRSKMPGATDARAAEGRAHSMTLARGRMILELRGASWSGPDIWRFPTIIVAFGLRAFISSG